MGQRWARHKLLLTGSPVVLRNNKCMQSQPAYTYHTIRSTMDSYIHHYNSSYIYICIYIYASLIYFFCLKFLHKTKSDSLGSKKMSFLRFVRPCGSSWFTRPTQFSAKWIKPIDHDPPEQLLDLCPWRQGVF